MESVPQLMEQSHTYVYEMPVYVAVHVMMELTLVLKSVFVTVYTGFS